MILALSFMEVSNESTHSGCIRVSFHRLHPRCGIWLSDQLPVGRYQIATLRSTNNNLIYVIDTATGKTWCFGENLVENEEIVQKWVDYGSPTDIKK
jgi:hypothetical protein